MNSSLAKGFGVRKLGEPSPVDDRTLFAIGSCTKAFTAAALGMLVDEGKPKWDDPVTRYLPWFQMYDPYITREMTVRDLLSHRSGLQTLGGDLIWYHSTYDRDEVIRRVRFLKPASGFRSRFGYHYDTFLLRWPDKLAYPFPKGFVTFALDAQARVAGMIDQPNNDFNFDELDFKRSCDASQ